MQRQKQLTEWLSGLYPNESFTIAPASADASFRRYFRVSFTNSSCDTLIVMDAPPQHEDCKPFLHVGKLFEDAGTHVPHVYAHDLTQGFLLLSDLGNITYLQALCGGVAAEQRGTHRPPPCGGAANNAKQLYGAATDALIKIQLASKPDELPPYNETLLRRELNLFPEWYISKHLGITLTPKQSNDLERSFQRILANNLAQPCVYVHRDYHSRNLMFIESPHLNPLTQAGEEANEKGNFLTSPGILDFQDAVYGPITYDLASLFKDAYIRWEEDEIMDWLISYWEKARKAGLPVREDFGEFYRDYEMMGAQRHIKVLGIFARLYHRDGKEGYLKDMPLVMKYLHSACERYIDLKPLLNILLELNTQIEQAEERAIVSNVKP